MKDSFEEIRPYVAHLVEKHSDIREVWLFGSRANSTASQNSDWDLLAASGRFVFESLREDQTLHFNGIDLFVACAGEQEARTPWGNKKVLNMNDLEWTVTKDGKATYRSSKFVEEGPAGKDAAFGHFKIETLTAVRLWPRGPSKE